MCEGDPRRTPENAPEFLNSPEGQPRVKPYQVMLRDSYERIWIELGSEYEFESKEDAIKKRDEENLKEFNTVNPPRDHYGVMDMSSDGLRGYEIECPASSH